jgi:hypothetical protein
MMGISLLQRRIIQYLEKNPYFTIEYHVRNIAHKQESTGLLVCSSVVQDLPSTLKVLGSTLSTGKKK